MNTGNLRPKIPLTCVDWPSALFLFIFLASAGYACVYGQLFDLLGDKNVTIAILFTLLGFSFFIIRQYRRSTPYLDLRIFRYRNYAIGFLLIQILYLAKGAFNFTTSYFSGVLGLDQCHLGMLLLFNVLGVIIGTLVSSRMIQRRSYRLIWIIGFSSLLCYYFWMENILVNSTDITSFIFPLLLQGFGVGMLLASIVTFMIVSIPIEMGLSGITTGIMGRFAGTCFSIVAINAFQLFRQENYQNNVTSQLSSSRDYYGMMSILLVATVIFIAVVPLITNDKNNIDPVDNLPI